MLLEACRTENLVLVNLIIDCARTENLTSGWKLQAVCLQSSWYQYVIVKSVTQTCFLINSTNPAQTPPVSVFIITKMNLTYSLSWYCLIALTGAFVISYFYLCTLWLSHLCTVRELALDTPGQCTSTRWREWWVPASSQARAGLQWRRPWTGA